MNLYGIDVTTGRLPELDPDFIPILRFQQAFSGSAGNAHPVGIAVERADGQTAAVNTFIHGTAEMAEADRYYIDRIVKTLLWMKGGFRIYVSGNRDMYDDLSKAYADHGTRDFDFHFMSQVFDHAFEVVWTDTLPAEKNAPQRAGGFTDGNRIGFDAGGSDRKVSAVIDGESVYDEEVVWFPKTNADPAYHYDGIVAAFKSAASHMPRVDAVGISSAGIYIGNRTMRASLFAKVPETVQLSPQVRDIYIRAVRDTFGDIPFAVANDGDVSALAGVRSIGENNVLGIAMGTSEAAGFVDQNGCITGWLNELAFVPVDCARNAPRDEWSGDIGCGVKYFSQDAVIRLAPRAGIMLDEALSPAEKLKAVQSRMESGDENAARIYETIGVYLGHTLAFYHTLYGMRHVLLLGRVMSGKGGDLVLKTCRNILSEEYAEIAKAVLPALPDEKFRRVGQSAAAASLPPLVHGL
ncbi:MAG: ROK family protein [Lachnospiraceae bacterium]|nr:ROK family protein [Lachnospiraceae bacterium]